VILQSLKESFDLPGEFYHTPTPPGTIVQQNMEERATTVQQQSTGQTGPTKVVMARCIECTQEVSRSIRDTNPDHYIATMQLFQCSYDTPERGLVAQSHKTFGWQRYKTSI
jgi:hypothetical protein